MEHMNQWPPVLLRRWLLQILTGLGCLLIGIVVFLVTEDQVLLILSVLLTLLIAVRCMSLYQQIARGKYETVEGVCIRIKKYPAAQTAEHFPFSRRWSRTDDFVG